MINGCLITKYFRLKRGARQGGPISAYHCVLALEIIFVFITLDKNIDGINIFNHECLYTVYADDTEGLFVFFNFFSVKNALHDIKSFSNFSALHSKINVFLDNKKRKIKQNTLRNNDKDGGLKIVDIDDKIAGLKYSWVKRICTENYHE